MVTALFLAVSDQPITFPPVIGVWSVAEGLTLYSVALTVGRFSVSCVHDRLIVETKAVRTKINK